MHYSIEPITLYHGKIGALSNDGSKRCNYYWARVVRSLLAMHLLKMAYACNGLWMIVPILGQHKLQQA